MITENLTPPQTCPKAILALQQESEHKKLGCHWITTCLFESITIYQPHTVPTNPLPLLQEELGSQSESFSEGSDSEGSPRPAGGGPHPTSPERQGRPPDPSGPLPDPWVGGRAALIPDLSDYDGSDGGAMPRPLPRLRKDGGVLGGSGERRRRGHEGGLERGHGASRPRGHGPTANGEVGLGRDDFVRGGGGGGGRRRGGGGKKRGRRGEGSEDAAEGTGQRCRRRRADRSESDLSGPGARVRPLFAQDVVWLGQVARVLLCCFEI